MTALIRCTVLDPTPNSAAIFKIPLSPCARAFLMLASGAGLDLRFRGSCHWPVASMRLALTRLWGSALDAWRAAFLAALHPSAVGKIVRPLTAAARSSGGRRAPSNSLEFLRPRRPVGRRLLDPRARTGGAEGGYDDGLAAWPAECPFLS